MTFLRKNRAACALVLLGVILLAFGVGQAEHQVVFRKAVTICMEGIGLG